MKNMKKLFAIVLAVMMVMSLAATAFAAEGDIYEIYQIFTGENHNGVLSNVKWGENGTGTEGEAVSETILNELTAVNNGTDAEKLAVIKKYADLDSDPHTTGSDTQYTLDNGYYLVKNVDGSQEGDSEFYTLYVVKVVDETLTITPKGDAPEVVKTVDDDDASIGDTVTFTLTATMPTTFNGYSSYKVVFTDTMYKGLTYNGDATVSVEGFTVTTDTDADGNTVLTITNGNVLDYGVKAGDIITVTYTATLNSNAIIGTAGNSNKVKLTYSNDPNRDANGDEPTGDTPEDEVKVYTWEIPVFKYTMVNGAETALAGAGFTLYTDKACTNAVKLTQDGTTNVYKVDPNGTVTEITTDTTGKFEIEGLAQGTYYLKETTTPAGYNTCADITVTIGEDGKLTQGADVVTQVKVQNNSGSTLPSTGGIGTTIFYTLGGIMVLAAVVLLVTKKRMSAAE